MSENDTGSTNKWATQFGQPSSANDQTNVPPPIAAIPGSVPPLPPDRNPNPNSNLKPFSWWLRKFFACNPFYLVSAALLLYGCYRISMDAQILSRESARLIFNFTSVQVYEVLLVVVAIFLARRSLWYDSTLLTGLDNMLVFVPFILISQAALTDEFTTTTEVMCAVGVTLAILRSAGLRRFFKELNLPDRLLSIGFVFLLVNVALPLSYRYLENTKYGTHLDYGPAFEMNEETWLFILPAVLALANLLPRAQAKGDLLPQHRWLPLGFFSLWLTVTGVHLYALDYVYEYYIRPDLFAPVAWVLAWTIFLRCPANWPRVKAALSVPALLTPLLATSASGTKTLLVLTALNMAVYLGLSFVNRKNRLAPHLVCASALMLLAGLPDAWLQNALPGIANTHYVLAAVAAYLIFWTAWLRDPKLAVFGSMILGCAVMSAFHNQAGAVHWALQSALVFLLLHSLRWNDAENIGAVQGRMLVAVAWAIESFVWMNSDAGKFWMPFIPGGIVFAVYCLGLPCRGIWRLFVVPAAAGLVILSGPCCATVEGVRAAPAGLLAVIASFLFLGFGTVAALTRHLWHKHEQ